MDDLNNKWESGELGRDEKYVKRSDRTKESLHSLLGLKSVPLNSSENFSSEEMFFMRILKDEVTFKNNKEVLDGLKQRLRVTQGKSTLG